MSDIFDKIPGEIYDRGLGDVDEELATLQKENEDLKSLLIETIPYLQKHIYTPKGDIDENIEILLRSMT